jgi:hypothetical protein
MGHFNIIQTKNLAITALPKTASTNLVEFFVDRFDNIIETDDDIINMPNIIIVITRNERERWCSGVIQELDPYFPTGKNDHTNYRNKKIVSYILDKEADSLGQKSIFTSSGFHSHLGTVGYLTCITELALRDNTFFTDISSLSKRGFWAKICELDSTWPNLNEWWNDWNNYRNGIHGPPDLEDEEQNERRVFVSIVEDMLNNDTRLDFISAILDDNQETIDYFKETDKWIL